MWSIPSLAFLLSPIWPGVEVPVEVPCMDQIELFINVILNFGLLIAILETI